MSLDFYIETECEHCGQKSSYSYNVTHNLGRMADEAGVYKCLWRPSENGFEKAKDIIEPLEKGLALLKSDKDRFVKLTPDNGWGSYEWLVEFLEKVLETAKEFPEYSVRAWV